MLSRHTVLPWEDRSEYQALLDALVAEHAPDGPTEEHLVEELAGIIWRKRRLRMAEAAVYREKLRQDATSAIEPEQIAGAALLPVTGSHEVKADIPQALAATPDGHGARSAGREARPGDDRKAVNILVAGGPDAYARAVAALREDTRSYWLECLEERRRRQLRADGRGVGGLDRRHWKEWYEDRSPSWSTATRSGSRPSAPPTPPTIGSDGPV